MAFIVEVPVRAENGTTGGAGHYATRGDVATAIRAALPKLGIVQVSNVTALKLA